MYSVPIIASSVNKSTHLRTEFQLKFCTVKYLIALSDTHIEMITNSQPI